MKNRQHAIDNFLVIEFIEKQKLDRDLSLSLINWHSALSHSENEKTRLYAKEFIKKIAQSSLKELLYPDNQLNKLVNIFEPLEELLRLSISLQSDSTRVRDHLSHTIRNLLFSNYLYAQYKINQTEKYNPFLNIAALFHDIAYPVEKLTNVTTSLEQATFIKLLNTKGKISITLSDPNDFIEVLHLYHEIKNILLDELRFLRNKIRNNKDYQKQDNELFHNHITTLKKWKLLYRQVIFKSIAREGLFEEKHFLTSVILFIRPILLLWKINSEYWKSKLEDICDICLTMAYHDRSMKLEDFKKNRIPVPLILKTLKIADELQEWDRDDSKYSYIKDVEFDRKDESGQFISLTIKTKDKSKGKNKIFDPYYSIGDKIEGLIEVCNDQHISLKFDLPRSINDCYTVIEKKRTPSLQLLEQIEGLDLFESNHIPETILILKLNKGKAKLTYGKKN